MIFKAHPGLHWQHSMCITWVQGWDIHFHLTRVMLSCGTCPNTLNSEMFKKICFIFIYLGRYAGILWQAISLTFLYPTCQTFFLTYCTNVIWRQKYGLFWSAINQKWIILTGWFISCQFHMNSSLNSYSWFAKILYLKTWPRSGSVILILWEMFICTLNIHVQWLHRGRLGI